MGLNLPAVATFRATDIPNDVLHGAEFAEEERSQRPTALAIFPVFRLPRGGKSYHGPE